MFIDFFYNLRKAEVPVTLREYLMLLDALDAGVIQDYKVENFYYLARASLVKDEKHIDRFDLVFGDFFKGIEYINLGLEEGLIPADWFEKQLQNSLTDEEKEAIEALGGFDKLMEEFQKRLDEQDGAHHGGSKWIGTGGTSPFGNNGYNPEGVRVGGESRNRNAAKVWDKREFKNFDDTVELGTRNIKVALKRLRNFAREGAEMELDLDDTVRSTANNGGYLDIKMVPERHNAVKVLLFLDVGGSMDDHIRMVENLFSAARTEFKHLEYFYFHNFIYDRVWKSNHRRFQDFMSVWDVLHKYGSDYKVIYVGDAAMSPYEVTEVGGCMEYFNEEPGVVWLKRLLHVYPHSIWLNPAERQRWDQTQSNVMIRQLMEDRMFPLTVEGLETGMKLLSK